jgi:hypothetical protein
MVAKEARTSVTKDRNSLEKSLRREGPHFRSPVLTSYFVCAAPSASSCRVPDPALTGVAMKTGSCQCATYRLAGNWGCSFGDFSLCRRSWVRGSG